MVDRKYLEQAFSLITVLRPDGVITVKDGIGTVSHSDTANAALVYTSFNIPFPDGVYGVDFEKVLTLIRAYTTKEIDIGITTSFISLRSGGIKNRTSLLNIPTLQPVRPKSEHPLPCIVEVNTAELVEVIKFIESVASTTKNSYIGVYLEFDGDNLSVLCPDAEDTVRTFELASVQQGAGTKYKSLFSFDFLRDIVKAIGKIDTSGKTTISIGNEMPCRIQFGSIMYVIANRIDGDNN